MSAASAMTSTRAERPLLCFIHIPKTAGTSVSELLRRNFAESFRTFVVSGRKDATGRVKTFASRDGDIQAIVDQASDPAADIDVIAGHMAYGIHEKLARKVEYFSIMREPLARSFSQYFHILDETRNSAGRRLMLSYDFDFRKAIEAGAAVQFSNDQTRMITGSQKVFMDEEDLARAKSLIERRYVVVGTQERLPDTLQFLGTHLGMRSLAPPKLNVGRTDIAQPSEELRRLFEEHNLIDRKLYDWVSNEYLPARLG